MKLSHSCNGQSRVTFKETLHEHSDVRLSTSCFEAACPKLCRVTGYLVCVFSLHVICTLCTLHIVGCHVDFTFAARGPKQELQLNGCFYRLSAVVL